jgi:hypothetical protein
MQVFGMGKTSIYLRLVHAPHDPASITRAGVDMDPECIKLCDALNELPGVRTIMSCCGHGRHPFTVDFLCSSFDSLLHIAQQSLRDPRVRAEFGTPWKILVRHCNPYLIAEMPLFWLQGLIGRYEYADDLAGNLARAPKPWTRKDEPDYFHAEIGRLTKSMIAALDTVYVEIDELRAEVERLRGAEILIEAQAEEEATSLANADPELQEAVLRLANETEVRDPEAPPDGNRR